MPAYRLYGCDAHNRIVFGDFIDCAGPAEARESARAYLATYPIVEVWDGKTRLFQVRADATAKGRSEKDDA